MVAEIPAIVYAHSLVPELSIPVTFIGVLETVAAAALLIFLVVEAMTRPIARRALAADPQLGVPPPAAATLRRKLIVGLPIVNMMTAYVAAGGASAGSGASERLAAGVFAAFVVSLTVSLVLTTTLSRSLSAPVDDLVDATERVEHGDLEARLTPLAADELGTLAGRFNQMLIGLRERESLRADVRRQADELRESRTRIVAAADAERRRVERDLHDGAQQQLVLAQLKLGVAESAIGTDPDVAKAMVVELRGDLRRALAELRDLAHGIYPAVLENEGLPAALREAAARAGLPATFESAGTGRYPPGLEAALYFCCLEALQNIAKHAGEDPRVAIVLAERDHHLLLEVADTGRGFDSSKITTSSGLTNMTDRVGALGGALEITSSEGQGTTIAAIIPLDGSMQAGGVQ
jgi:signal transduction histidine kinase